jgi:hypothetical protein
VHKGRLTQPTTGCVPRTELWCQAVAREHAQKAGRQKQKHETESHAASAYRLLCWCRTSKEQQHKVLQHKAAHTGTCPYRHHGTVTATAVGALHRHYRTDSCWTHMCVPVRQANGYFHTWQRDPAAAVAVQLAALQSACPPPAYSSRGGTAVFVRVKPCLSPGTGVFQ